MRWFKWIKLSCLSTSMLLLSGCFTYQNHLYEDGHAAFVRQDYHIAFVDLQKAAEYGNTNAQYAIGYMYYYGLGTAQSDFLARVWLYRSAKMGNAKAINALARLNGDAPRIKKPLKRKKIINKTLSRTKAHSRHFHLSSPHTTMPHIPKPSRTNKG